MKKLVVALSLMALTLPVFAGQAAGQTPPAQEQTQTKAKKEKTKAKQHKKKGSEESKPKAK